MCAQTMSRNLRFKISWASFIIGSKFIVFALCYFVFEGNFPSTSPRGAYIWRGNLTKGFLRYRFGGVIFGGAYTWRAFFFQNFSVPGLRCRLCWEKLGTGHDVKGFAIGSVLERIVVERASDDLC